ncbi:unnamed protein product [Cylicostephanus goldi]|uniref:Uncharacterized protein n=1 Tax=Cylicostephanus goldi TaxID=71465 RepID=A0A3P6QUJ2_CYLGO|nr:unnamed protein product [Cylicostephanus goldi]
MESSINTIISTKSHREPDKHTYYNTRQHGAQQGEEDRTSHSGGTRTGPENQSGRELSDVEHFPFNCGGIERHFGDQEMKDNELLLMRIYCSVREALFRCLSENKKRGRKTRSSPRGRDLTEPLAPPTEHHERHASICTKPKAYTQKVQPKKDLLRRIDRCKEEIMNLWSATQRVQEEERTPD